MTGLSVADAAKKLASQPAAPAPAPAPAPETPQNSPADAAPETPNVDGNESLYPQGDAAPDTDPTSGTDANATEPAEPPIEPPASWGTDIAEWSALPRQVQDKILKRERDRDADLRRRQNEAAEARKAIEAQQADVANRANSYASQAELAARVLQEALFADFPEVKTWADANRLAQDDPARYATFLARQQQIDALNRDLAAHRQQQEQIRFASFQKWVQDEEARLPDLVPEWKDAAKARADIAEIRKYLAENGVPRQDAEGPMAAAHVAIARKAMLYDRAQKAKVENKVANLPKVVRPGNAVSAGEASLAKYQQARSTLSKTGSVKDAAAALRALRRA